MTIVLGALMLEILLHVRCRSWNPEYISHRTTIEINGIFVLLVFLSHFCQYLTIPLPYSHIYYEVRRILGQLVVTTFLFYSGYGVMYCIQHQKERYIDKLPKKICEMILMFSIAVLIYVIIQGILGKSYSVSHILYSCIGWKSVGNSNWYLFVILLLYGITYFSFKVFRDDEKYALFCILVLSLFSMIWLKDVQNGTRWYNTFLCYPAGVTFCIYQKQIEKYVMNSSLRYWCTLLLLCAGFIVCYKLRSNLLFYELHGILFVLIVTAVSMKIVLHSTILEWVGKRIFGIYILQRIVMILGENFGLQTNPVFYFIFCLIGVMAFAQIFQILTRKARKLL